MFKVIYTDDKGKIHSSTGLAGEILENDGFLALPEDTRKQAERFFDTAKLGDIYPASESLVYVRSDSTESLCDCCE